MLAILIYWFVPGFDDWRLLLPLSLIVVIAGMPVASAMARRYGDDPSEVVIDEIAGQWIALLFLPRTPAVAVSAFLLFRLFDIIKPPPANYFDRMKSGFGVMMDDVAAAVYANILVQFLLRMHIL